MDYEIISVFAKSRGLVVEYGDERIFVQCGSVATAELAKIAVASDLLQLKCRSVDTSTLMIYRSECLEGIKYGPRKGQNCGRPVTKSGVICGLCNARTALKILLIDECYTKNNDLFGDPGICKNDANENGVKCDRFAVYHDYCLICLALE